MNPKDPSSYSSEFSMVNPIRGEDGRPISPEGRYCFFDRHRPVEENGGPVPSKEPFTPDRVVLASHEGDDGGVAHSAKGRLKVGVLASGRGSNLDAIARACEEGRIPAEVVVVICDVDGAGAFEVASRHGIPAILVRPRDFGSKTLYETEVVSILNGYGVELVALAGYMRIVGKTLLQAYRGRMMNIHPSLLPAFPGLEAQKQALEYGVKVSGCTVHFVDEGVDSGPIVIQRAVEVLEEDTPATLAARILQREHEIFPEAIRLFAEGRLRIEGRRVRITE